MLREALVQLYEETSPRIVDIKFDKSNPVDRTIISIYASIVQYVDSSIFLINSGRFGGVEAMQRSALEAQVDLVNLANDDNYLKKMLLDHYDSRIAIAKRGIAGNKFLIGFAENKLIAERLVEYEAERAKLVEDTGAALKIREKFRLAGMEEEYLSVYKSLCDETHNSIGALTTRHIRGADYDEEVVIFERLDPVDADSVYNGLAAILAKSNFIAHHKFRSPSLTFIIECEERLTRTTEAYLRDNP